MKLLEKARKLNRLMQNGERVKYKEVALLLKNLISSNVYVIDVNGTILDIVCWMNLNVASCAIWCWLTSVSRKNIWNL